MDYIDLKEAIANLIAMANFINEFKRRKEIGMYMYMYRCVQAHELPSYYVYFE